MPKIFQTTLAIGENVLYNENMETNEKSREAYLLENLERFGVTAEPQKTGNVPSQIQIEKDFADILNYERKQRNNLLGVFVGEKYKISDEMAQELVAIPKKFDRIEGNVVYVATILGEFVLNFKIELAIESDFCNAKLILIETEQDVEENIKHLTTLAEIVEPYMFEFRNEVCKRWNVYYDDEVVVKGDAIYKYLHMQSEEFLFNRELVEILSQLYLVRMLALLDKMGQVGEKARFEFKLLMEKYLANDPSFTQNYTMQKRLLDFVLRQNKAFEKVLESEEGRKILQGYAEPLKNIRDKTYPTVLEEARDNKKTETEKKKEAPKGAVKAKKSSPAKKADGKAVVYDWKNYKPFSIGGVSFPKPPEINTPKSPKTETSRAPIAEQTSRKPRTEQVPISEASLCDEYLSLYNASISQCNEQLNNKLVNQAGQNVNDYSVNNNVINNPTLNL